MLWGEGILFSVFKKFPRGLGPSCWRCITHVPTKLRVPNYSFYTINKKVKVSFSS